MKPEESILLNVVSAMVDFSTSASLQLSRKLDQEGGRTILCVTKVDQHVEEGLKDKIEAAIKLMSLRPDHVFPVRNRSQKQNNDKMPLVEVRELEASDLRKLSSEDENPPSFGSGFPALSKRLVEIQHEQILKTLPHTRKAIGNQISCLQDQLNILGEPLDNPVVCRAKTVQFVESCVRHLQDEIEGRAVHHPIGLGETCEGKVFEIHLKMDDFAALQKHNNKNMLVESAVYKDVTFDLEVFFSSDGEKRKIRHCQCFSTLNPLHPK